MADPVVDAGTPPATGAPSPEGTAAADGTATQTPDVAADVAALKQELAEARRTAEQARLDGETVKRATMQLIAQIQAAQQQPDDDGTDPKARFREQLEQDPQAAIDQLMVERMGPVLRQQYQQQSTLAKQEAQRIADAEGWGEEWAEYAEATDKFMADVPLDRHVNPKTWVDAFKLQLVMSGNFDAVAQKRGDKARTREKQMQTEGASLGRIAPTGPPRLSEAEKRMAKAIGMSEADYLKNKQALVSAPLDEAS